MKLHALVLCAATLALSGCTTIGSLFADNDSRPSPIDMANAYVPAASPMPSDFCERVGANARHEALNSGFDIATQDRIALRNFQQCETFNQPQYASL